MTVFKCGPQTKTCHCTCGQEGERVCEHEFDETTYLRDESGRIVGGTRVCSRCGLTAMEHSIWTDD